MIDSTKSPVPAWKRYGTMVLLAVLVLVAAYFVYTKDIHKSSGSSSAPPAASTAPTTSGSGSTAHSAPAPTTTTVVLSSRDPFSG